MTRHEQSSGQTVREILETFTMHSWPQNQYASPGGALLEAEAAINAHVVSVLEKLKSKKAEYVDAVLIEHVDTAISKYKQETK